MTPRKYRKVQRLFFGQPDVTVNYEVDEKNGLIDDSSDLGVKPGHWEVADPDNNQYPVDENGERALFRAHPTRVKSLFGSGTTSKTIQHLLAMAHQDAKKVGTGTLTYEDDLSRYSQGMVRRGIKKGYIDENPELPLSVLEDMSKDRRLSREEQLERDKTYGTNYAEEQELDRKDNLNGEQSTFRSMHEVKKLNREQHPENWSITDFPDDAGEKAVQGVLKDSSDRKRREETAEMAYNGEKTDRLNAEEAADPGRYVEFHDSLFKHANPDESRAWWEYMNNSRAESREASIKRGADYRRSRSFDEGVYDQKARDAQQRMREASQINDSEYNRAFNDWVALNPPKEN
jgi:hypothetical protein